MLHERWKKGSSSFAPADEEKNINLDPFMEITKKMEAADIGNISAGSTGSVLSPFSSTGSFVLSPLQAEFFSPSEASVIDQDDQESPVNDSLDMFWLFDDMDS